MPKPVKSSTRRAIERVRAKGVNDGAERIVEQEREGPKSSFLFFILERLERRWTSRVLRGVELLLYPEISPGRVRARVLPARSPISLLREILLGILTRKSLYVLKRSSTRNDYGWKRYS